MPNQPGPANTDQSSIATSFSPAEWELLVSLPRRVLIAAFSAETAEHQRTVAEGLAGMEAMASGRGSASPLVREVVWYIYAERGGGLPADDVSADRDSTISDTVTACEQTAAVLRTRAAPDDAEAYRRWLRHIAASVCAASGAEGARGPATPWASLAGNRFLGALDQALGE